MNLRRVLLDNLPLKIIALILSVVLFIVVRGDRGAVTSLEIPLLVRVPTGYVTVNEVPEVIRVHLKGSLSQLNELHVEDLGSLSLSPKASEGRAKVLFHERMLTLPPGVELDRFDPPFIMVALEKEATRKVPVNVEKALSGEPPPGFQLGKVTIDPSEVEITGARSSVENVNHVFVENIDLTGQTRPFQVTRFVIPDRRSVQVEGNPEVTLKVEIVRKTDQRVVIGVPILILNLTRPFQLHPSTVDLVLVGDEEALAHLDPSKLVVTLDGSAEEDTPAHTQGIQLHAGNIYNVPQGVAVDESRLPVVFLQTLPEVSLPLLTPLMNPKKEDPSTPTVPGEP